MIFIIPLLCTWFASTRIIVVTAKLCCCCENPTKRGKIQRSIVWLCLGSVGLVGFIAFSIAAKQYNFMVQFIAICFLIGVPPVAWLYTQKDYEVNEAT